MKLTRDQWQAKLGQAMANAASLPVHKPISQEERNELTFELLLGTEDKAWQAILLLRQNGYRGKEMAEAVNKVFQLGNEERLSLEMVRGVLDESEKRKATGPKLRLALEELLRSTLPADCLDAATVSRALRSAALKRREIARAEYETQPSQEFKEKAQKKLEEIKALGLDLDCVRRWTCKGGRAKKQATEGTNTSTTTAAENSDATQSAAEQSAEGQVKSKPGATGNEEQIKTGSTNNSGHRARFYFEGYGKPYRTELEATGCAFDRVAGAWYHRTEEGAKKGAELIKQLDAQKMK
jgi:hypothetical protein